MAKLLKRILVAEDEPDISKIADLSLTHLGGYSTHVCEDGEQAIAAAAHFKPDLIILDVMMPNLDGPETLKALRKIPETADVPVVFLTARIQPDEIDMYRELGVLNVIGKPFDAVELPKMIDEIWENHAA
ncbi:response regulator [Amaricoccus tamworthensis]|uniref:response regulator n=1 Tax=Amaricoccus tamworthensis TaxID=57002 RepID=UPI003C79A027